MSRPTHRHDEERQVECHGLPGHGFGDAKAFADLRQQTGRHVLGHDGEEASHGEGKQLTDRKAIRRNAALGRHALHVFRESHWIVRQARKEAAMSLSP